MYKKILVANRGEIAVRIMRTCKTMGIATVAVYSKADEQALHVQLADQQVCIGEGSLQDSYLNMDRIISAALSTGADAIHPGYGFLSENSVFAKKCIEMGIDFIGPSPEVIRQMGNKAVARKIMAEAGIPVVPGGDEPIDTPEAGLVLSHQIGFPVIIKAAAGGGGKGMRIVYDKEQFIQQFQVAQREAATFFNDPTMYIEKYIERPRHVEIQVMADKFGRILTFGERDCSIQRNHQKLIEESPSPAVDESLRKRMQAMAARAVQAVGYYSAGTIEFIMSEDSNFFFMEMNTRIQVEHGVTEMVTDLDLIEMQIEIGMGYPLSLNQESAVLQGHAIECRINAENPVHHFRPCPGEVTRLHLPGGPGIRIDTALYAGYRIPPEYDSMILKIIARGKDRPSAIKRMRTALEELVILGIDTTADLQYTLLGDQDFAAGKVDTDFLRRFLSYRKSKP